MNRRNAIKNIGIGTGLVVSAGALTTLFSSCETEAAVAAPDWTPTFLSNTDSHLLDELSDILLPKTDTPGAKEAKVVRYMDQILTNIYKKEEQEAFKLGLTGFKNRLSKDGTSTEKANRDQLTSFLTKNMSNLSDEEYTKIGKMLQGEVPDPKAEGAADQDYYFYNFMYALRDLSIAGYFGSELIGENHLAYLPVPGPYEGCVPLSESGGVAWSL